GTPPRPPQVETGNQQQDRERGDQLDESVTPLGVAEPRCRDQRAVHLHGDLGGIEGVVLVALDLPAVRVDVYRAASWEEPACPAVVEVELDRTVRADLRDDRDHRLFRVARLHGLQLLLVRGCARTRVYRPQVAVHHAVDLRLQQVDDPAQRKHHDHWDAEDPGIEVPAPGRAVQGGAAFRRAIPDCFG